MAVINGTDGADTLAGTSGNDEINGLGGNDLIMGSAGADKIDGGAGTDTVDYSASTGAINIDLRYGVVGRAGVGGDAEGDTLFNIEKVIGTAFSDTLSIDTLNATLEGGAGDDVYIISNTLGTAIIEQAGGGNDEVRTSYEAHYLAANVERLTYTGTGAFTGVGNAGDNIITGGIGNDTFLGGAGADQFIGGAGMDTVSYNDSTVGVALNFRTGINSGIAAGDTYTGIERILGSNYNDTFVADSRAFAFDGGTGTDTVDYSGSAAAINVELRADGPGRAGTGGDAEGDTLFNIEKVVGSAFNDTFSVDRLNLTIEGGAGNDVYIISNALGGPIIEQANGGDDEVRTSFGAHTLAANVERLTYTGTGAFTGVGNAGDNIITGGIGNDTLLGGAGADQFIGGAGIDTVSYNDSTVGVALNFKTGINSGIAAGDTYTGIERILGSNYNDTFVADSRAFAFDGGTGTDTVDYSGSSAAINVELRADGPGRAGTGGDAEGDTLFNIEKVVGSAFNDTFSVDRLNLTIEGGAGDDVYIISNALGGPIIEQANGGDDEVRTSFGAHTLSANVERLTYTGTGAFTGVGNAGDNIITGGIGNDTFLGGAGADQFIGGAGMDTVSYTDSTVGVTLNFKTGVHSGIATGDTYDSVEAILGSNYNDIFVGDSRAMAFNGGTGIDVVSYESSDSGVTIDLKTKVNGGDASGDTYTGIELFQGSQFADTLSGSTSNDNFIGGAGADVIDGREGIDTAWYVNSNTAVNINLLTGVNQGGDAQGDVLINVESIIGSNFNDILIGNAAANGLEGGLGNDTIYGGDGDDTIYGSLYTALGPFAVDVAAAGPQADMLYGGNGNDVIFSASDDRGTIAFGEAGNDKITVVSGTADGGEGADTLIGAGNNFSLLGGAGNDTLQLGLKVEFPWQMKSGGFADGGEGDDTYIINTNLLVTIQDTGTSHGDKLVLNYLGSGLLLDRVGDDLYLHGQSVAAGEIPQEGVRLKDWFAGFDTIEQIQTADNQIINLPANSDAFSLFG